MVAEIAESSGWKTIHFYDVSSSKTNLKKNHAVLGDLDDLIAKSDSYDGFHVAIGLNKTRLEILKKLKALSLQCPNIIHPSAVISKTALLDYGICIMPNVIVNANSKIGAGVILNSASSVDHDCKIDSGVHLSPAAHLAGGVTVGYRTWIGIGASVIEGINIGSDSIIGAGSVVIKDIPNDVTSVGVPSKVIR